MSFLVDANVLIEATRPAPDGRVLGWLRANERRLIVNPIVLGEIEFGILLLPKSAKRRRLENWFEEGVAKIRCVPWDAATARRWAKLLADLRTRGLAMQIKDSLIAATALAHDLTLATRNVRDFARTRVRLVNPFVAGV